MNRATLLQYGVPIAAIVIFVGSIVAVASCGETVSGPEEQAVLSAYQQGYVDGYSKGYAEGFAAGSSSSTAQPQVTSTTSRGCATTYEDDTEGSDTADSP